MKDIYSEKNLVSALGSHNQDMDRVLKLITPFNSNDLVEKKKIELWHVGLFVSLLNNEAEILIHDDVPDFIVSYKGRKIGLEHQRILVEPSIGFSNSFKTLVSMAANVFRIKYPNINFLAAVYWSSEDFKFKKADHNKIANDIADYIYEVYVNIGVWNAEIGSSIFDLYEQFNSNKPNYIERVSLTPHDRLDFDYNPGGYVISDINENILENEILRKEELVNSYREKSLLEEQWLLLVLATCSPDSYHYPKSGFQMNLISSFDKIFVLEDFDRKIYELK